jgi:hypothetical protein
MVLATFWLPNPPWILFFYWFVSLPDCVSTVAVGILCGETRSIDSNEGCHHIDLAFLLILVGHRLSILFVSPLACAWAGYHLALA